MNTEQLTQLKSRIQAALDQRAGDEALFAIVREHYAGGGTQSQAYNTLQEVWEERGYHEDEHDAPDPKRDALEYVMERVWYGMEPSA
jgi:hypothetical protein